VLLVDAPDFNLRLATSAHALGCASSTSSRRRSGPGAAAGWTTSAGRSTSRCASSPSRSRSSGKPASAPSTSATPWSIWSAPRRPRLPLREGWDWIPRGPSSRCSRQSPREVQALLPSLQGAARLLARRTPRPQFLVPAASAAVLPLLAPLTAEPVAARVVEGRAWIASPRPTPRRRVGDGDAGDGAHRHALRHRLPDLADLPRDRETPHQRPLGEPAEPSAREPAVLELLQRDCRPETIAAEIERFLDDPAAAVRLGEKCGRVRALLGPSGAAARAAPPSPAKPAGQAAEKGPSAASGFALRHCGVLLVRLIPQDSPYLHLDPFERPARSTSFSVNW